MNVATSTRLLADTPYTWADPEPQSTLTTILVFVGIPLLIMAVITLLVMAPSLAKGPRYRPGQDWNAEPEWIGASPAGDATTSGRQLGTGASAAPNREGAPVDESSSGGASARW